MNSRHRAFYLVWIVMLFANRATFGKPASNPRTIVLVGAAPAAPTITILAAASGTLIRSLGVNSASLDLGRVSYFQGSSVPGQSIRKNSRSFVISTRFGLRVDCPGSSSFSRVTVTMSRLDSDGSYAIRVDGIALGSAAQTLVQSIPCGSASEHRLDVSVPISSPAGPIDSTIALAGTLDK
jgi:hypothetical protein